MTLAKQLAARIVGTTYAQLSMSALRYAKSAFIDTIGVGVAGSAESAAQIARRVLGPAAGGASLIWGTSCRTGSLDSAFLNGISANVLDFDDCNDSLGGHPSSPILPALIGLAQERQASGADVLAAYVAGVETETCLGLGVNFHHYEKGWHPTATLGVFGAAAACSRLMGLDEERTMHAIALSASLSAGIKSNVGSMAKPMHIGHASRSGLLAARLAAEGFSGMADALEHHQGFLEVFNGAGNYDAHKILAKWGTPWDVEMPGIAIKQYPCCLSAQAAADAMIQAVRTHDIRAGDVVKVDARISARRLQHTDRPEPRSALDAKLSIQYVLARALVDREVTIAHFEDEHYQDAAIRAVMASIRVEPLDPQTLGRHGDFYADVVLTLKDGRRISGCMERPVGHHPGLPLDIELVRAKFESCVARFLDPAQIRDFLETAESLEKTDSIQKLTRHLVVKPLSPAEI